MTEDELNAIEGRIGLEHSWKDVPNLVAEVRRLRALLDSALRLASLDMHDD